MNRIIDFHVHVENSESDIKNGIPAKRSRDKILKTMEEAGIHISVLLVMAQIGAIEKTQAQNNWLSNLCQEDSRFIGFGSVHPGDGKIALEEMNRCVEKLGLKGFKLHPNTQNFDCGDPALIEVLKKAAELKTPVIIDSYSPFDDKQPSKLLKAALASPETKLCFAHVGLYRFLDFNIYGFLKQQSSLCLNVYFDLSAACLQFYGSPFQEQFCWVTKQIGPDNLLFGSDFPFNSPKRTLEVIKDFGYPAEWISRIIGENAAKLLGLS
jgi:predicted TIM-barrel fold metal-dependent hydrolase